MLALPKNIKNLKYDRVLTPFWIIILPGILLHGFVEYYDTGISRYLFRDVFDVSVAIIGLILYSISVINKKQLLGLAVYGITFAVISTFIIGYFDPVFEFEAIFFRAEMIFALMIFVSGTMLHFRHLIALTIINFVFIVFCFFTVGKDMSLIKFVFCNLIVTGAGALAFAGQRMIKKLYKSVKNGKILIEKQNEDLRAMNASKDQLFRIIGHDLRTPFHQLNLLVDLIIQSTDSEERKELGLLIKESAEQGGDILEDLLGWAKAHVDEAEIERSPTYISQLIAKIFELFKFKCETKRITLINEMPKDLMLNINESMMETVFRNLIGNAIKFSHPDSTIVVKSILHDDLVTIQVIDHGVGISKDRVEHLITQDRSISTPGTNNEEGTGYGLGIVKKLIKRQMGTFDIQSELGKGTTISFSFSVG